MTLFDKTCQFPCKPFQDKVNRFIALVPISIISIVVYQINNLADLLTYNS